MALNGKIFMLFGALSAATDLVPRAVFPAGRGGEQAAG
jgi:hypothetical protein